MLHLLPQSLSLLIASLLWPSKPISSSPSLTFQLRHQYGIASDSRTVFADVSAALVSQEGANTVYVVDTQSIQTHKPGELSVWSETEVLGPNVTNRETLRQLALMTSNAYEMNSSSAGWYNLGPDWNNAVRVANYSCLPRCITAHVDLSVWMGTRRRRI
jgi:putative lipase involved disintegration of autophagic bodies